MDLYSDRVPSIPTVQEETKRKPSIGSPCFNTYPGPNAALGMSSKTFELGLIELELSPGTRMK